MLLLVIILKALVEVAALSMLSQGLLFVLAGAQRERNLVYKIFATVNSPVLKVARFLSPRFVVDAHVGFVGFFLLVVLWIGLVAAKVYFYLGQGAAPP